MDDRYVGLGLRGMAAAGEPFMAHFGAALLAAWWFDRDARLPSTTSRAMSDQADAMIAKHAWLFEPRPPDQPSRADRIDELVDGITDGLDHAWAIGHDVIYCALVLRTLKARPEFASNAVIDGVLGVLSACRAFPIGPIAGVFGVEGVDAAEVAEVDVTTDTALAEQVPVCNPRSRRADWRLRARRARHRATATSRHPRSLGRLTETDRESACAISCAARARSRRRPAIVVSWRRSGSRRGGDSARRLPRSILEQRPDVVLVSDEAAQEHSVRFALVDELTHALGIGLPVIPGKELRRPMRIGDERGDLARDLVRPPCDLVFVRVVRASPSPSQFFPHR